LISCCALSGRRSSGEIIPVTQPPRLSTSSTREQIPVIAADRALQGYLHGYPCCRYQPPNHSALGPPLRSLPPQGFCRITAFTTGIFHFNLAVSSCRTGETSHAMPTTVLCLWTGLLAWHGSGRNITLGNG
jgi:hypothetical protein